MEGTCDLELGLQLRPHEDRDRGATTAGRAQFTIMYKGEVLVCEGVSEAQAKAILLLASRGAGEAKKRQTRSPSGVDGLALTLDPPALPENHDGATSVPPLKDCDNAASSSAISMKRSLQRFLEKRKLRLQRSIASPY